MTSFVFNKAATNIQNNSLSLSAGQFYLHAVTQTPLASAVQVSELTIPAGGSSPIILNGRTFANNVLSFSTTTSSPVTITGMTGTVLCKQAGESPASTDPVISYAPLPTPANLNGEPLQIEFGANGALKITPLYGYLSGNYNSGLPATNGSIYLLGTANGTTTYTNPMGTKIRSAGSSVINNNLGLFDRNAATAVVYPAGSFALDFYGSTENKNRKIKLKSAVFRAINSPTGWAASIHLSGSNFLSSFTNAQIALDSNWTNLGNVSVDATLSNFVINSLDTNTYWRYLRLKFPDSCSIYEADFFASTILSPDLDMVN